MVKAVSTEFDLDEETGIADADLAVRTLDERLYNTTRYDAVVRLPLADAVNAVITDLGLRPYWTGTAPPPPDPPPRMTRAP